MARVTGRDDVTFYRLAVRRDYKSKDGTLLSSEIFYGPYHVKSALRDYDHKPRFYSKTLVGRSLRYQELVADMDLLGLGLIFKWETYKQEYIDAGE